MTSRHERPRAFLAWSVGVFGRIALNRDERAARFIEEAIELVHAEEMPRDTVERILARVYERPAGSVPKEVGQAMATLECLAENLDIDADAECSKEFARVQSIPQAEWDRRHSAKVALSIANLSPVST